MIKEMIKKQLSCEQYTDSGEYETRCTIDFILKNPINLNILGKEYILDRITMRDMWGYQLQISLADEKRVYNDFLIPYKLRLQILDILEKEQKEGSLKGWDLTEDIYESMYELLDDKDTKYCFGCSEKMNDNCTCIKRFYQKNQ